MEGKTKKEKEKGREKEKEKEKRKREGKKKQRKRQVRRSFLVFEFSPYQHTKVLHLQRQLLLASGAGLEPQALVRLQRHRAGRDAAGLPLDVGWAGACARLDSATVAAALAHCSPTPRAGITGAVARALARARRAPAVADVTRVPRAHETVRRG